MQPSPLRGRRARRLRHRRLGLVLAAIGAVVLVFVLLRLRSGGAGARSGVTDVADGRQILIAAAAASPSS